MKRYILIILISILIFIISVIGHNAISYLYGKEEAVLFIIATILCPITFITGVIGTIIYLIKHTKIMKQAK